MPLHTSVCNSFFLSFSFILSFFHVIWFRSFTHLCKRQGECSVLSSQNILLYTYTATAVQTYTKTERLPCWQDFPLEFLLQAATTLQWRHDERDGVSNHRRLYCLLNRLLRPRSKKTSKLRVTGLCKEKPLVTGGFPSQRASKAENISIWWRHHEGSCRNDSFRYS